MRDSQILKHISSQPGYMQVILKGKQPTTDNTMTFPPSGVIPFHGFSMYGRLHKLVNIYYNVD